MVTRDQPPAVAASWELTPRNVRAVRFTSNVGRGSLLELQDPYAERAAFMIGYHDADASEIVVESLGAVYTGTRWRTQVDANEADAIEAWYRRNHPGRPVGVVGLAHTHLEQRATELSEADRFSFSGWAEELRRAFAGVVLAPYGDLDTTNPHAEYGWNRHELAAYVAPSNGGTIYPVTVKIDPPE